MKRALLFLLTWAAVGVSTAQAGVMITLDNPVQSGVPGASLHYFGRITNLDPEDPVYFNSDSLNLFASPGDFFLTDRFFDNVPGFIDPEMTTETLELFSVIIADPFLNEFGPYTGNYQLLGGLDANAMEILGTVNFSVTPVSATPEPGPSTLIIIGGAAIAFFRRRTRLSERASHPGV